MTGEPPELDERKTAAAVARLKDRYATGDFSGALLLAEQILAAKPDHADAQRYRQRCCEVLEQMLSGRLAPLSRAPRVVVPREQIQWLSLDHQAGFLLALMDGRVSLEEVLDMSAMPRLDALKILVRLLDERVIEVRERQA